MKTIFKSINYNLKKVKIDDYWKLHVSCRVNNFYVILNIINKICKARNIFFKFPNSKKSLYYILCQKSQKWIYGKVFTIYFTEKNDKNVKIICEELYKELKDFNGPRIDSDIRYKNSIIHIRYGTYFKENFSDGETDREKKYFNVKSNVKIPGFIKKEIKNDKISNNIDNYEIEKILISDNFHTILITKKNGIKYIMKAYKKYTQLNFLIELRNKETKLDPKILSFFNKDVQNKISTKDMCIYISKYIDRENIHLLIKKAEQSYLTINDFNKFLMIEGMINIFLYLEKNNMYWIDFNLRNMIFFNKKISAIDLKYIFPKKDAHKIGFSTKDFQKFETKVNKILLLDNILIIKFGYYHFEHLKNSYFKKLMALRILIMSIGSSKIQEKLFNIFEIKRIPSRSDTLKLIDSKKMFTKPKFQRIFRNIIDKDILSKSLSQNRGVWAIERNGKFYTGLKIGGLGYLIFMHIKTNNYIWLKRIQENSNYFSIINNSIEHGMGGYVLAEMYLLVTNYKTVNEKKLIQKIELLKILDWKVYQQILKILK